MKPYNPRFRTTTEEDHGEVWYFRENPQAEPHSNAMAVVELVVKHRLPISMSTRPKLFIM